MSIETSRRGFLKGAAASAAAVFVIGFDKQGALAAASDGGQLTPFIRIDGTGQVTAIIKHIEKGQGTATGLSSLIAEELNMTLQDIDYDFAPSDPAKYNNLFFGPMQGTGGSTALANSFMQYRTAGAAAREMLESAAAKAWGMDVAAVTLKDGMLSGGGKSAPIADFLGAAAALPVPAEPKLKDPSEFRVIGNPQKARKDNAAKINGTAKYAMDIHLDNQMVVAIKRTPRYGGTAVSFDDSGAKDIKGYIRSAMLPNKAGIAVYAENTWAAFQARDGVTVEWDFSKAENRSSDQIKAELLAAVNAPAEFPARKSVDLAATSSAIEGAAKTVSKEFWFPMLAHAPMEPMTATVETLEDGTVMVHNGSQFPTADHMVASQVLQVPMEQVQVKSYLAGGSFGRRITPDSDYMVELMLAYVITDRKRPLKLVWSREDDIAGGYYRPAFAHKVTVGVDDAGKIVGWDHRIAGQSIMKGTAFEQFTVHDGVDHASVEGVVDSPYAIPGMYIGLTDAKPSTTVNWWRSVGHSHTAFVMESMMDEAAKLAGKDPLDFRLDYLSDASNKDHQRKAGVLKLAAEKAGWGKALPTGRSQGLAVHKSFSTYVAEVVEISRDSDDAIKIEKVTCAVDCGIAVNPDVVIAQMEGGIGYGIGHAMRDEVTLDTGEVVEQNFPDYEPLRIGDIAAIETHIVPSAEPPTGVGEPGTPPASAALVNAIAANDGPRVTMTPLNKYGVDFV